MKPPWMISLINMELVSDISKPVCLCVTEVECLPMYVITRD